MIDIVQRLRLPWADMLLRDVVVNADAAEALMEDAANEIERLRNPVHAGERWDALSKRLRQAELGVG